MNKKERDAIESYLQNREEVAFENMTIEEFEELLKRYWNE